MVCGDALRDVIGESRAQATVEMAVVAPVLIVLALVTYNLMQFLVATARFDRVAPDMVIAHGVAPVGDESPYGVGEGAAQVREPLQRAMDGLGVEVGVEVADGNAADGEGLLSMVGPLRTYVCTMTYVPWPGSWSIAGVTLGSPVTLRHVRECTVDPWRSGVVV